MSFLTNVYRAGAWVTESVSIDQVVGTAGAASKERNWRASQRSPRHGILTRTLVESPLVHWILPIRLHATDFNHVAFVGDRFVEVRGLRRDGQWRHIAKMNDFASRIRNARIISSLQADDPNLQKADQPIKEEDVDVDMPDVDFPSPVALPQDSPRFSEMLALVLDTGDCVFMFIEEDISGESTFVTALFPSPRSQRLIFPGFHLAVDPSARYVALGCAQDLFLIYELAPFEDIKQRYMATGKFQPVILARARHVIGVIHKMEFLHPSPNNPNHVILVLIIVHEGVSRLITYDWLIGDDIDQVFMQEKRGHVVADDFRMPLLLIPLIVGTAFLAVCSQHVAVCKNVLDSPTFEDFSLATPDTTDNHLGKSEPIWTTWTRPNRLKSYFLDRDIIYLAREDAIIAMLDLDREGGLATSLFLDKVFSCNIATAFACLSDRYCDIQIMGGVSGPGEVWKSGPRRPIVKLDTIQNWSPTFDFVVAGRSNSPANGSRSDPRATSTLEQRGENESSKIGRVFVTSGRGKVGCITELRRGLLAKIGCQVELPTVARQAWIMPSLRSDSDCYHLVTTMATGSAVYEIKRDLTDAVEVEGVPYDLSSRTILVSRLDNDTYVHITERSITLRSQASSSQHDVSDIIQNQNYLVSEAVVLDGHVFLAGHALGENTYAMHILQTDGATIVHRGSLGAAGEISSVALTVLDHQLTAIAGIRMAQGPGLQVFRVEEVAAQGDGMILSLAQSQHLDPERMQEDLDVESSSGDFLTSIVTMLDDKGEHVLVAGTRDGEVITICGISNIQSFATARRRSEKFGLTSAQVSLGVDQHSILVSCDSQLVVLSNYSSKVAGFKDKSRAWAVDAQDPSVVDLPLDAAKAIPSGVLENGSHSPILLVSGSSVLIADLPKQPGTANRSLPVGGSPTKVIFSASLNCLIVGVDRDRQLNLVFLDPDSGEELGFATDKDGQPVDFLSGLADHDDRILGLAEWVYRRDNKDWRFILVSTAHERLMVVSVEKMDLRPEDSRPRLRYWTRYKKKNLGGPVTAVHGVSDGILYCVGTVLYWDILDIAEKKLRTMRHIDLGSAALALGLVNGKIAAVTARNSLMIVDHHPDNDDSDEMRLLHVEAQDRHAVHFIDIPQAGIDSAQDAEESASSSLIMVSDRDCEVAGLWVPWHHPGSDCSTSFRAEMPSSICRFRRGRLRPSWKLPPGGSEPRYGRLPTAPDDSELLGISVDGALFHFTLLDEDIWRVLRFIQNLALKSELLYPFIYRAISEDAIIEGSGHVRGSGGRLDDWHEGQIDGDMLQRLVDKRALEDLLATERRFKAFQELLEELDEVEGFEGDEDEVRQGVLTLGYDILEYYLSPVM